MFVDVNMFVLIFCGLVCIVGSSISVVAKLDYALNAYWVHKDL